MSVRREVTAGVTATVLLVLGVALVVPTRHALQRGAKRLLRTKRDGRGCGWAMIAHVAFTRRPPIPLDARWWPVF
jgi:hypothetical protein